MRTFILRWKDDKSEEVTGKNLADAALRAGFSYATLQQLSGWTEKKDADENGSQDERSN